MLGLQTETLLPQQTGDGVGTDPVPLAGWFRGPRRDEPFCVLGEALCWIRRTSTLFGGRARQTSGQRTGTLFQGRTASIAAAARNTVVSS